jgi:hypothetical protein
MALSAYNVRGAYFESCNCAAICPCRVIGGVPGGRSTYGVCDSVLSWLIREGSVGNVDVRGLAAVLVCRYDDDDDDEPGSPWTIVLHVDRRGNDAQDASFTRTSSPSRTILSRGSWLETAPMRATSMTSLHRIAP